MRGWGISSAEDLTMWLRGHGFPGAARAHHITARAQEFLLSEACAVDARVALLEAVYVQIAIHRGRQVAVPVCPPAQVPLRRAREIRRPPPPQEVPVETWAVLDEYNLSNVFLQRVAMLKKCPHFLRGRLRHSFGVALRERARAKRVGDDVSEGRAWKLFGLIPMLLHRPRGTGAIGRDELAIRVDHFIAGRWRLLISSGQECMSRPRGSERAHPVLNEKERRGRAAQSRVQQGQVSRARHELTGAPLAPKNEHTYRELQDRRPREQVRPIPREVLEFNPSVPLQLEIRTFVDCLRSAPAGSAPGPGGCSYEMLKVCLDDPEVTQLLFMAAEDVARGTASDVSRSFMLATMTAISKRDGGVRGIATGAAFRRLVAKTLARQFGAEVEKACAPFQFALSTRAGTDCVGHAIRASADANPRATVLSIDGIGGYDHVLRSAMLTKLVEVPQLQGLVPYVRSVYALPTRYAWEDEQALGGSGDSTPHWQNASVEPSRRVPPRTGRFPSEGLEPRKNEDSRDSSRDRGIRERCVRRTHRRRRDALERHPLDPGLAVRLAGVGPVCWSQVPPYVAHHASTTFSNVRARPRRWHATCHVVPSWRVAWERRATKGGVSVGVVANAHGGSGPPIGCPLGSPSFLGILGGRVADVPRAAARARSSDCPQHVRRASWVFRGLARSVERAGSLWVRGTSIMGGIASRGKTRSVRG